MNDMEHEGEPIRLAWGHWLSIGLSIGFLCAGNSELSLRYPLPIVGWVVANVVLAVWRLFRQPMWSIERQLLKPFAWIMGLLSPLMLLGAWTANDDVIFRDADTAIRQHRTEFSFGGGPDEEEIVTTHYRTRYGLYEEKTGQIERKPAEGGR
jgi:hypothetical protein